MQFRIGQLMITIMNMFNIIVWQCSSPCTHLGHGPVTYLDVL